MTDKKSSTSEKVLRTPTNTTSRFAAIDFETANDSHDSACALGVVIVEGMKIVDSSHYLIRPPTRNFMFTYLHNISWDDVADKPSFRKVWHQVVEKLQGVEFLAAHWARFDRSVLFNCCNRARLPLPTYKFQCTVKLARQSWNIRPTKLPYVCGYLGIPLRHHNAISDAEACANIIIAAQEQGLPLSPFLQKFRGWLPNSRMNISTY